MVMEYFHLSREEIKKLDNREFEKMKVYALEKEGRSKYYRTLMLNKAGLI